MESLKYEVRIMRIEKTKCIVCGKEIADIPLKLKGVDFSCCEECNLRTLKEELGLSDDVFKILKGLKNET